MGCTTALTGLRRYPPTAGLGLPGTLPCDETETCQTGRSATVGTGDKEPPALLVADQRSCFVIKRPELDLGSPTDPN